MTARMSRAGRHINGHQEDSHIMTQNSHVCMHTPPDTPPRKHDLRVIVQVSAAVAAALAQIARLVWDVWSR